MRAFSVVLLACLASSSCNPRRHVTTHTPASASVPSTLIGGTFITTSGSYTHGDADATHELRLNQVGPIVHWYHSLSHHTTSNNSSGSTSSSMALSTPADPWFVYVETPERLWFFNGKDSLFCRISVNNKPRTVRAISGGELDPSAEPIPAGLAPRLPAELQKIVPPPAPIKRLPSI